MKKNIFKSESDIYSFWEKENSFSADPNSGKKPYSLLIPPPNLTGELHLGHAMQHSILDAVARFKRLQGFDVLLLPGVDHAGIQFEATFDKVLAKQKLSKLKLGREEWLKRAWEFKEEVYNSVSKTWRFMGLSADWSREVFTLDTKAQKAVFEEFKTYYDAGLIYKGPYIVQWCPKCNTAIEDVEVEYEERKEKLYYLKYGPLILATVRPETKFGDTAMAVNPKDKRYKDYAGREFEIETLSGKKKMQVVADDAVDPKFGTGVVKVTPGHDFVDYEIGKRHHLPILQVIDKNGKLTSLAGKYAGMKVEEARKAMIPELMEKGILVKEEDYVHNVAVCERCKTTVEPIISEEWFVKVEGMAKDAVKVIKSGKINFLPKNYAKILIEWLENIHDWCISRSLWWGHRIPVWYSTEKNVAMKVSLESPGGGWKQDEQVLDTWFSSGLWPLSTLGWSGESQSGKSKWKEMQRYFPWDFETSAGEIKFLWIARMIMISNYFTGQVPFKTMFFHGMIRDLAGRKFSKSLGNGIDPILLRDRWGTDALRMALYGYSVPGRDGRASTQTMDERAKNFRNFATKMRNIAKFILELKPATSDVIATRLPPEKQSKKEIAASFEIQSHAVPADAAGLKLRTRNDKTRPDDIWIVDELERVVARVTNHLEKLELHLAVEEIYEFVWHKFADKYIEESKNRRAEAQPILEHVLRSCLILLHPFMPFLTEEIYQQFDDKKKSITMEQWPI